MARETFQRVDIHTVNSDTNLIAELSELILNIDKLFKQTVKNVDQVKQELHDIINKLGVRTKFHMRWGLEKVRGHVLKCVTIPM